MAVHSQGGQGSCEIDNDSDKLEDIDADEVLIGVVLQVQLRLPLHLKWPLQVPPEP